MLSAKLGKETNDNIAIANEQNLFKISYTFSAELIHKQYKYIIQFCKGFR